MLKRYRVIDYNFKLVIMLIAISVIGILAIGSANSEVQSKQMVGLIVGVFLMVVISLFDYHSLHKNDNCRGLHLILNHIHGKSSITLGQKDGCGTIHQEGFILRHPIVFFGQEEKVIAYTLLCANHGIKPVFPSDPVCHIYSF